MGVISITQRSEKLGNIGATSMAHGVTNTDIGTVRHHVAHVYSPRYFAKNSHAGDAAIQRGLSAAADVFAKVALREDERQADQLVRQVMDNLDRMDRDDRPFTPEAVGNNPDMKHVLGEQDADGNYLNPQKRGIRLRTGEGTKTIVDETDQTYGEVFSGIADGMDASESVRRRAHERLAAYQRGRVDWALNHQASEYRRMELNGASEQLNSFIAAYKNGNSAVVGDIFEAREKLGILEGKTPEARKTDQQTLAVALAGDLILEQTKKCGSREDFDALIDTVKKLDKDSPALPDAIRSRLPDGKLGGKNEENVLEQVKREKDRFIVREHQAETAAYHAARQDSQKRELELLGRPVPGDAAGQKAYYKDIAKEYEALSKNEALSPSDRLHYLRTSKAITDNAESAEREENYAIAADDFAAGFTVMPDGSVMELNGASKMQYADKLLHSGKITARRWRELHAAADREWDDEALAVRSHVLDLAKKIAPNAIKYRAVQNSFAVAENPKLRSSSPTPVRMRTRSGYENLTYGQLVEAMNLTLAWRKAKGASVSDANAHFDKLVAGTVAAQLQQTAAESLEYERKTQKAFEGR